MASMDLDTDDSPRERIIAATAELLDHGGREAVSTRAVSAAAGVQAPTIYRLFGDKQGLLDAVATHGFTTYLADKVEQVPTADPVQDLRVGWDLHVDFGLANPAVYSLMYDDARAGKPSPSADAAVAVLTTHLRRIAEAGRLRLTPERAMLLVHAAGRGITLTLIAMPVESRDLALSQLAREAVLSVILTDPPAADVVGPVHAAVTLSALLPQTTVLTGAEQTMMQEWLRRIVEAP